MTTADRPRLGRWKDQHLPSKDRHVVVFVHGILSDSSTFDKLLPLLDALDTEDEFDFWVFDYDYKQTITESGDQLAHAIQIRSFGSRRVDIVGHSMGGLVARLAVLRNRLPNVYRIVTLATPNHGAVSGAQLNLLGQMTALAFRRWEPIYARAPGIIDLTNVHAIMRTELKAMHAKEPSRLDGKSYVSIPAQYFHDKRQVGETPPSLLMGSTSILRSIVGLLTRIKIKLRPVHDGIVEERSNQLHPAPVGSSDEGAYMHPRTEAAKRMLHATHEAGSNCDHVTVTASREIADLIQAVLRADILDAASIDPLLHCPSGLVKIRPHVL
jgi:pimeloyl-ACP methyl ester carboxylesterase